MTSSLPGWLREARNRGLLSRLPDPLVLSLARSGRRVEYPAGTIGLRWDERPMTAIVLRGTLRAFIAHHDGRHVTTRYLGVGEMTGVFAPRRPALARGVQALDSSELLLIDGERVRELARLDARFAWAMIEELTSVLNVTHRALSVRAFGSVRQRIVGAIVDRARASGGLEAGRRVSGTQQELATAVGTAREVVASILHDLKHEGALEVRRGAIVVLDPARLASEAGEVEGRRLE
jgi:CRP/FNR family transcriptional regulator, cyclic AMP receptor protein